MKKYIYLTMMVLAACLTSCREEADPTIYYGEVSKLAYSTYTEQFHFLWKNISTGYVFWDVDTTDWDAKYDTYTPVFQQLDARVEAGQSVSTRELRDVYKEVFGGMRDHHMVVYVVNLHKTPGDAGAFSVSPGRISYQAREERVNESNSAHQDSIQAYVTDTIVSDYAEAQAKARIVDHRTITFDIKNEALGEVTDIVYSYNLFKLPDGRYIPYLWQQMAILTPVLACKGEDSGAGQAAAILDEYFSKVATLPRDSIAGFILDNRGNSGGYQDDLDYLVGSHLNEEVTLSQTRYKDGPGRLEYSPWTDYKQKPVATYHRDITSEDIPYVILCDMASISMGELETIVAQDVLPTVHTIGERTYGATGPLQNNQVDLNYASIFGDSSTQKHYVYTSTFEMAFDGKIYEGVGYEPRQLCIRKEHGCTFRAAIDAALEYCSEY